MGSSLVFALAEKGNRVKPGIDAAGDISSGEREISLDSSRNPMVIESITGPLRELREEASWVFRNGGLGQASTGISADRAAIAVLATRNPEDMIRQPEPGFQGLAQDIFTLGHLRPPSTTELALRALSNSITDSLHAGRHGIVERREFLGPTYSLSGISNSLNLMLPYIEAAQVKVQRAALQAVTKIAFELSVSDTSAFPNLKPDECAGIRFSLQALEEKLSGLSLPKRRDLHMGDRALSAVRGALYQSQKFSIDSRGESQ